MIQGYFVRTTDRIGWETASWRIYLASLAVSFFVFIEPAPTDMLFVLAFLALMLGGVRPTRLIGPIEVVGISLYLWFTILSLYFAVHAFGVAVRAAGIEVYLLILYLMTAYFARQGEDRAFRFILIMLMIGGFATSVIGYLAYLDLLPNSHIYFRDAYMTRIKSTFKDPNVLGPYLVPTILLGLWMVVGERRYKRIGAVVAILAAGSLLLTFSRGAWVHAILSVGFFITFLFYYPRTRMTVLLGSLAIAIIALLGLFIFQDAILGTVEDSFLGQRLSLQEYDDSRFANIWDSVGLIVDFPLGIGPNQVRFIYGYEPHNTFVVFALHNGILASVGFAILYFAAAYRCLTMTLAQRDGWLKYAFLLSVMIGLFVLMNVVGSIHWRHLFVVMGLAYGTYRSNSFFPEKSQQDRKTKMA